MMHENRIAPQATPHATQPGNQTLEGRDLPTPDRTGIFTRMVAEAAMIVALAGVEAPAQPPTGIPTSPTPASAPVDPATAPPTSLVAAPVLTDKTDITQLKDRKFSLDDDGNVLIIRKTQVRNVGQEAQGLPTYGEAFRAICEGVEFLKKENGGRIPPGFDVKLRIRVQGPEESINRSIILNPNRLVGNKDLCPDALNTAMADPDNKKAIESIRNYLDLHVVNTGNGITGTFIPKERGSAVQATVELVPQR